MKYKFRQIMEIETVANNSVQFFSEHDVEGKDFDVICDAAFEEGLNKLEEVCNLHNLDKYPEKVKSFSISFERIEK